MLASGLKNAPYGHHRWVWRQINQSRMDSLLPSRIACPTYGHFLGCHVRIGMVDNRHSRLQTGGHYYLPWRALSCIVALVSACLPWCCQHACFWCGFVSISGEVDFFHLDWNVEYRSSVIFALTNCGFHFELQTNCGTFQFMTSAVRCLPPRQKLFPHSMSWPDQITHPSFLARERNLLTQNGARGQSSQPRFVIWWISQKHLLQMESLSPRASSSHCIRCLVLWRMSTKRASRYSRNRLALSSTFRRRKRPW